MQISFAQRNAARSRDSDQTGTLGGAGQIELKKKNYFTAVFSCKMRLFEKRLPFCKQHSEHEALLNSQCV